MSVQLSILVAKAASLVALGFTRIEVWRSVDDGSSYEEVTDPVPSPATVTSLEAVTTYRMGGKLLKVVIDGGPEIPISFGSVLEHWTTTQVAARINEIIADTASEDGSYVSLSSMTVGRGSTIEVTYCDAADLGFPVTKVYGKAARIPLTTDTSYTFSDPVGKSTDRYRWRFSFDGADPLSEFSSYVPGGDPAVTDTEVMSVCSATLLGADGKPVRRKVIIGTLDSPQSLNGYLVGNDQPLVFEADVDGFVQFSLMRGLNVRVCIEGTSFVREFTVPDAATFDLLTAMSEAADPYTIQAAPELLIRRSV